MWRCIVPDRFPIPGVFRFASMMANVVPCLSGLVNTLLKIIILELLHGEQVILLGQLLRIFSLFDQQDLGMIDEKGTQIDNYKEQRTRFCVLIV